MITSIDRYLYASRQRPLVRVLSPLGIISSLESRNLKWRHKFKNSKFPERPQEKCSLCRGHSWGYKPTGSPCSDGTLNTRVWGDWQRLMSSNQTRTRHEWWVTRSSLIFCHLLHWKKCKIHNVDPLATDWPHPISPEYKQWLYSAI